MITVASCGTHTLKVKRDIWNRYSGIRKISGLHYDDYWDALKKLGLYSLEWRRDRYRVIYLWKTIEGLVPPLGLNPTWNPRRGRTVKPVDVARNAAIWVRNAKVHSFRHVSEDVESSPHWYPKYHSCFS